MSQTDDTVRDYVRGHITPGVLFTTRHVLNGLARVGIDMSEPAGGWQAVDRAVRHWVADCETASRAGSSTSERIVKVVKPEWMHPEDRVRYAWFPPHILSYQGDARRPVELFSEQPHHVGGATPDEDDGRATDDEIKRATQVYGNDNIEVDTDAKASRTDQGVWVQGWLYLAVDGWGDEE